MDSIIIFCAKYLVVIVVLIWLFAWAQSSKKHRLELALAVVIAGIIAVFLDKIAGKLYYDPRPFVTHHFKTLVAHAADNGFPSEHTVFTMTLSTVLIFYRRKLGELAFALSLIVGIGRIAAHIHSPIDIVGGIIIGVIAGYSGYWLAKKYGKLIPHWDH